MFNIHFSSTPCFMPVSLLMQAKRMTSLVLIASLLETTLLPVGTPMAFAAENGVNALFGNLPKSSTPKGQKQRRAYMPRQVLVKFKDGSMNLSNDVGKKKAKSFASSRKLEMKTFVPRQNLGVMTTDRSETVEQVIARLKTDPNVEYAEPNYTRSPDVISTNDTFKDSLWALDNIGQTVNGSPSTSGADINAPQAWAISEGQQASPPVIVAVIDTGVMGTHSDLSGAMWDGSACLDEAGNALGGCQHGYDFADNDKDPTPVYDAFFPYWHGTAVSGVIAATKNNNAGVIGIAPNVKIMALRFGFDTASEVQAIDFAIANHAKVINASYGGSFFSQAEQDAITRFRAAGGLFVAAAGNSTHNNDSSPSYPASYALDNIISVAATDQDDHLAWFSNFGAQSVDVGAPGVNIRSTSIVPNNTTIFNETFEGVTPPAVPAGWTVTSDYGTRVRSGSVGTVLYGDANHLPYAANGNNTATLGSINLTGAASATISFKTRCDTQYDNVNFAYTDYMKLEGSANGTTFSAIDQWDEIDLDDDTSPAGYSPERIRTVTVPASMLTSTFALRFHWISNGDTDKGSFGDGCYVDDVQVLKSSGVIEGYGFVDGTSFSSPYTAGLAGLILGYKPLLTASEVKSIILTSGDSLPALVGVTVSGKRINAEKALIAANPPVSDGALFVTRAVTPIRARQLLGGALENDILRLTFRADTEPASVTWIVLTGSGANAATMASNVDRLELYVPGGVVPFATATTAACQSDAVPANSMCARMQNDELIIPTGTQTDVIVRPRMRTDIDGAIAGQQVALTVDPTPSNSSGSIHARGVTSTKNYTQNDSDGAKKGEVFIGTQSLSAANVRINSKKNEVVLAKVSSITNADPNADGTAIPTGTQRQIGQFKFSLSAANNFKNGSNKFVLSGVIFNVNATNVQLGNGNNTSLATSTFSFYNKADASVKSPCVAAAMQASPFGQSGALTVTCLAASGSVDTEITQGNDATFVLESTVANAQIQNSLASTLQVSLSSFGDVSLEKSFGAAGTHLSWMDQDSGAATTFGWIEYPETVINGTAYGTAALPPPDTTKPVITLLGSALVLVTKGSTYTDSGATALDDKDGDITVHIVVTNPVNTALTGSYIVRYNVSDAALNVATEVTRTVVVVAAASLVDIVPPVITLLGTPVVDLTVGGSYTDAGATALDDKDGDITAHIVVTNPVNASVVGSYIVRYNVSDAALNAATEVTRTVNVNAIPPTPDTTAPVITLRGNVSVNVTQGSIYSDSGATANDDRDGDITSHIVVTNPVDTSTIGTYVVRYNVSDVALNAATEVTRTVHVVTPPPPPDTVIPVITLLGSITVILTAGDAYIDAGATALDETDGDITSHIVVTNPLNTSVAGTYLIRYNVTDAAGNHALEVGRTVIVNGSGGSSSSSSSSSSSLSSSSSSSVGGNEPSQDRAPPPDSQRGGGHKGHDTNVTFGLVKYVAQQHGLTGDVPPGGFGGNDVPLTKQETEYICSMQRALPKSADLVTIGLIAEKMTQYIGRDAAFITQQLTSKTLCADINVALRPQKAVQVVAEVIPFPLAKDGLPMSSNPLWNLCIRDLPLTHKDILTNPDVDSHGRHYSCDHYHRAEFTWRHPDLDMFFSWNPKTHQLRLPTGYAAHDTGVELALTPILLAAIVRKPNEDQVQ